MNDTQYMPSILWNVVMFPWRPNDGYMRWLRMSIDSLKIDIDVSTWSANVRTRGPTSAWSYRCIVEGVNP